MHTDSPTPASPPLEVLEGNELGPALHLLAGVWVASCPTCGFQLTSARSQERCERLAARRRCPVCHHDG
jgi:predicted RNA-binding Zn-ribbon protein involved in translation (DUF1610 family)